MSTRRKNNGFLYAGVGFALGCATTALIYSHDSIKADTITYNGNTREVKVIDDRIIVGTLPERLDDLLLEDPAVVKSTVEELLSEKYLRKE